MSHIPVNHPLRPLYRTLATLIGLFVVAFGGYGLVVSSGESLFATGDTSALGLRTNLAFSLLSIAAGVVVLGAVFVGRNVDRFVNLWGGIAFMAIGTVMLALMDTDLNALNFAMPNVIVSFVIGIVLFSAGLYGRAGTPAQARAEELVRHGGH